MTIYATRLNSSYFDAQSRLYNTNVNKEIVFHTEKCSVVVENWRQIKTFSFTETFFNEIQIKHRKCKLCESIQIETERSNYENEEQERQNVLRDEFDIL